MWVDIEGFAGWQVSSDGQIRRASTGRLKYLEPHNGYLRTEFKVNGARKRMRVHRLVAAAFLPNPDGKPDINHINGDKTDNRAENLEWCTPQDNIKHAVDNGLQVHGTVKCLRYATQAHNPLTGSGQVMFGMHEIRDAGFSECVVSIHVNKPGKLKLHKGHTITPIYLDAPVAQDIAK